MMPRMIYIMLVFWLNFSFCLSQTPPADTVYILFDQHSVDSLCAYISTSGIIPNQTTARRYQKVVACEADQITQITFHICDEEFVYKVEKHKIDTLSHTSLRHIKFSTLKDVRRKAQELQNNLNANSESTKVFYAYPKYMFFNTIIIEKGANQKPVQYETEWVEKIE